MDATQFEQRRLDWFRRHEFEGDGGWVTAADDRRTYVLDTGGDGVPTLLLHGGLAEASVWGEVAGRLDGRVVVADRPGCGLSDPIDYRRVDYRADAAAWLLGLVDALGVERVNLVGNSMGGYFAMAFALAHPDRVDRLVLVGAGAGLDRDIPLFIRLWGAPVIGAVVSRMTQISDPEKLRTTVFRDLVADPSRLDVEFLQLGIDGAALPGVALTSRTMLGAISTLRGFRPDVMLREDMASLTTPTTFLWGEHDAFAPPSSAHDLAARMPDATVVELAGLGHMPQIEEPELVADLVARALEGRLEVSGT